MCVYLCLSWGRDGILGWGWGHQPCRKGQVLLGTSFLLPQSHVAWGLATMCIEIRFICDTFPFLLDGTDVFTALPGGRCW